MYRPLASSWSTPRPRTVPEAYGCVSPISRAIGAGGNRDSTQSEPMLSANAALKVSQTETPPSFNASPQHCGGQRGGRERAWRDHVGRKVG